MRRLLALLALGVTVGLSGCGGGGGKATTPLDDALGYFPKDAPFVAAIETDPDGAQLRRLRSLLRGLPSGVVAFRLEDFARLRFVDWSRDIRPQLGAPIVIGLEKPAAGKGLSLATVVAMRIKHPIKAKQVLLRQPGFRAHGTESGVRVYENTNENRYVAVDHDMLVASGNRDMLAHALELKHTDNRMREKTFDADLASLPTGGVMRVSADPRMMIGADPRLRPALNVKWLAAMRRLGAVIKATPTGVTLDLRAATDAGSLSDRDLPLDPKGGPLPLIGRPGEIQVAVHGPDRLARLALAVWHAIAPLKAAAFDVAQPHGVDLENQLPRHLADPATFAIDPSNRSFVFRSALHDSAEVRSALAVLAPKLPDLAAFLGVKGVGLGSPTVGENFYALARPTGGVVVFGVVGDSFVAASDPRRAAALDLQPTHTLRGIRGSAVITAGGRTLLADLLAKRLKGIPRFLIPFLAPSLGTLSGALTIDRGAVRGHFNLTVVK